LWFIQKVDQTKLYSIARPSSYKPIPLFLAVGEFYLILIAAIARCLPFNGFIYACSNQVNFYDCRRARCKHAGNNKKPVELLRNKCKFSFMIKKHKFHFRWERIARQAQAENIKKNISQTQKKRDKDDMQLGREMMIRSPWDTSSGGRNAEERKPKEKSRRPPRLSASAVSTLQSSVPGKSSGRSVTSPVCPLPHNAINYEIIESISGIREVVAAQEETLLSDRDFIISLNDGKEKLHKNP